MSYLSGSHHRGQGPSGPHSTSSSGPAGCTPAPRGQLRSTPAESQPGHTQRHLHDLRDSLRDVPTAGPVFDAHGPADQAPHSFGTTAHNQRNPPAGGRFAPSTLYEAHQPAGSSGRPPHLFAPHHPGRPLFLYERLGLHSTETAPPSLKFAGLNLRRTRAANSLFVQLANELNINIALLQDAYNTGDRVFGFPSSWAAISSENLMATIAFPTTEIPYCVLFQRQFYVAVRIDLQWAYPTL